MYKHSLIRYLNSNANINHNSKPVINSTWNLYIIKYHNPNTKITIESL